MAKSQHEPAYRPVPPFLRLLREGAGLTQRALGQRLRRRSLGSTTARSGCRRILPLVPRVRRRAHARAERPACRARRDRPIPIHRRGEASGDASLDPPAWSATDADPERRRCMSPPDSLRIGPESFHPRERRGSGSSSDQDAAAACRAPRTAGALVSAQSGRGRRRGLAFQRTSAPTLRAELRRRLGTRQAKDVPPAHPQRLRRSRHGGDRR